MIYECFIDFGTIDVIRDAWMIIIMGSISNGERVRSKVRGIGSSGELDFRDAIRESTYGRVGRVKEDQWLWEASEYELRVRISTSTLGRAAMMFDTLFWKKLAKEEQRTVSGWSGRCLGYDLPTKVNDRL